MIKRLHVIYFQPSQRKGYICHFQGSAVKSSGPMDQVAQLYLAKLFMEIIICNASKPYFISSTYYAMPSPSNFKRWKLTAEASSFLSNKDTCTTSHILCACKVALSQGRFTFRHDNGLRIIISNIRSSIQTIKSSVPTAKQPMKRKFAKKGTKV